MLELIQEHTRKIYRLDQREAKIERVKARSLLTARRFDLFAKLFYIGNNESNPELARRVYAEHIKAFNPDLKEPGRDDKAGLKVFFDTFDWLIAEFAANDFDDTVSIVPVSEDGIILDGAHRVAALAFFDREVTIARCVGVKPKADFDFSYFRIRGLSEDISDIIAMEMCRWIGDIRLACLWPRMGDKKAKDKAMSIISSNFDIGYVKDLKVNLKSLVAFVAKIYQEQDWVGDESNGFAGAFDKASNCMASNHGLRIVIFDGADKDVIKAKEDIRHRFTVDKHCIHITDGQQDTLTVAHLVFAPDGLSEWKKGSDGISVSGIKDSVMERYDLFKVITLPKIKTRIYNLLFGNNR